MATQAEPLTDAMHDAVLNSPVGKYLDRLIREDAAKGGVMDIPSGGGSVIQQLWAAFMAGRQSPTTKET